MKSLLAIVWLTIKAAFRFRLFLVLATALLLVVLGLPALIKSDGSPQGLTQIILTYTLGSASVLLGFATLWLSCGTLARDIEECSVQLVVAKPISRWQIWLGKWLGITVINGCLLALAAGTIFVMTLWRVSKLPEEQKQVLKSEVLLGRGSVRPNPVDIPAKVEEIYQAELERDPNMAAMIPEVARKKIREMVETESQVIRSGGLKWWTLDLGIDPEKYQEKFLHLRIKFHAALKNANNNYDLEIYAGTPDGKKIAPYGAVLAGDTFHTIPMDPQLVDSEGKIQIRILNRNTTDLLFSLDDGVEVLYPEYSFIMNYIRGVCIILLWLGLFAAIGLASASFLSFPVAAFLSVGVLIIGLSSGTMAAVVEQGGVMAPDVETGQRKAWAVDGVFVLTFKGLLKVVNLVQGFSPIDSLSNGRSISGFDLFRAICQIGMMSAFFGAAGIVMFNRRELALPQNSP